MKSKIDKKGVVILGALLLAGASAASTVLRALGAPASVSSVLSLSPAFPAVRAAAAFGGAQQPCPGGVHRDAAPLAPRFLAQLQPPQFVEAQFIAPALPGLLGEPQPPQTISPDWCRSLPRPEYKSLERMLPNEPWFEVYKIRPGVFAIYEPHQAEEVISYLIVGTKQALLFDTGMGIANIRKVVTELTAKPVVMLNSHTHNDHVGGNYLFPYIFGMDTAFTRQNAKGSRDAAQQELGAGMLCGDLPKGFDPKTYSTKPWHVSLFVHDGFKINLGGGHALEIIATPGHTPDAIALLDRQNGLLFTGDTYYPGPIWLFRPETDLDAYVASVKKLAALEPQIKLVLGAHNVPVADPSILGKLPAAIAEVRAGKVEGKPLEGGNTSYTTEGITFLLASAPQGVK